MSAVLADSDGAFFERNGRLEWVAYENMPQAVAEALRRAFEEDGRELAMVPIPPK